MASEIINKKFLDGEGTGYLWQKIRNRYDSKLDSVTNANASVQVTNGREIAVKISSVEGNALSLNNDGLYVSPSGEQATYTITKDVEASEYAAVYHLTKFVAGSDTPTNVGMAINIPKDMVVSSGTVVTKSTSGAWGDAGTYIELTLANATNDKLYIPVGSLIEYVTSGSQVGDMVYVTVDPTTHQVTAAITDGTITVDKLTTALRTSIAKAEHAVQEITTGTTNGTISVDGVDVAVHGLGTMAYANAGAFDAAGSAAAVLGETTDTASTNTVYGVKAYASNVYDSIMALTNQEIDAAVTAADVNTGT